LLRQAFEIDNLPGSLTEVVVQEVLNYRRRDKAGALVWVIRTGITQQEVAAVLSGWADIISQRDSLLWLLGRFMI
jgi:hypothetical protein